MSITAVLSVNDKKASQLASGALRVFLSERVPGREGNAELSAPAQERQRKKQKSKSKAGASDLNIDRIDTVVLDDPVADAIENTSSREQVMLVMLQQLNNAFRERLAGVKRAVFNTVVQRGLAETAPRTMEELDRITVSGVSVPMKKKYGKYLIQAVAQVDAFIGKHSSHLDTMVDSFELDVDAILGPKIMTASEIQTQPTPGREGGLDWGESDDDWEIMPSENPDDDGDGPWNHVSRPNEF